MDLQTLLNSFITFLNSIVIPLLFGIAVLFFLWNATRYFIIGGANEGDQEKARRLAVWGILAFVIITALWGIVALITGSLSIDGIKFIRPDYECEKLRKENPGINCVEVQNSGGGPGSYNGSDNYNYQIGDTVNRNQPTNYQTNDPVERNRDWFNTSENTNTNNNQETNIIDNTSNAGDGFDPDYYGGAS